MLFEKLIDAHNQIKVLEMRIAELEQKLSRKPRSKTAQVQLVLEFSLEEVENERILL